MALTQNRCLNPSCPDRVLFGVIGEYPDDVEICPKCGAPLSAGADLTKEAPDPPDDVRVAEYACAGRLSNAAVVPVALSLLRSAGIQVRLRNEATQDLFALGRFGSGFSVVVGEVEFWVEKDALEAARSVLEELAIDGASS